MLSDSFFTWLWNSRLCVHFSYILFYIHKCIVKLILLGATAAKKKNNNLFKFILSGIYYTHVCVYMYRKYVFAENELCSKPYLIPYFIALMLQYNCHMYTIITGKVRSRHKNTIKKPSSVMLFNCLLFASTLLFPFIHLYWIKFPFSVLKEGDIRNKWKKIKLGTIYLFLEKKYIIWMRSCNRPMVQSSSIMLHVCLVFMGLYKYESFKFMDWRRKIGKIKFYIPFTIIVVDWHDLTGINLDDFYAKRD